jgi:hypothetical protein
MGAAPPRNISGTFCQRDPRGQPTAAYVHRNRMRRDRSTRAAGHHDPIRHLVRGRASACLAGRLAKHDRRQRHARHAASGALDTSLADPEFCLARPADAVGTGCVTTAPQLRLSGALRPVKMGGLAANRSDLGCSSYRRSILLTDEEQPRHHVKLLQLHPASNVERGGQTVRCADAHPTGDGRRRASFHLVQRNHQGERDRPAVSVIG